MASKTKSAEEISSAAAMKELRARDAVLARREYEQERLAIQARTERLRALRLERESSVPKVPVPAPGAPKKKAAKAKA